jgi:hypothetical protein|tara:strand:+ start:78 stop:254 length:177 start_codon:yes stop_codon:yes gene_type:complete
MQHRTRTQRALDEAGTTTARERERKKERKKEKARRFCLLLLQPPRALAHESESERQNK